MSVTTTRRDHTRGLQLAQPIPHSVTALDGCAITRRDILGGIIHEYERAA
jgi:hypothetical protein